MTIVPIRRLAIGLSFVAAAFFLPASPYLPAGTTEAAAKDPLFGKPFSFQRRNNPTSLSRAMLMRQVETAEAGGGGIAAGAAAAMPGLGGPGATSIANFNDIDVFLDDGAAGQVLIELIQDSTGDQTSHSEANTTIDHFEAGGQ